MENLFSLPYPYWHQTTIGRLSLILKHGLISPSEAKCLGLKNFRRNFKSSWNDDFISLMSGQTSREATAPGVAVLIDPGIEVTPAEGKFKNEDTNRPVPREVLAKGKIPPEKIIGVVIGEVGYSFRLEKAVKPRPESQKKVIEIIKKSGLNLPVYFKGKQIWP